MVEKYTLNGWEDEETGMLLYENGDWILVKHIPVDYQIDGFKIYNKKWVDNRISGEKEIQINRVLELKEISISKPVINLGSAFEILSQLESKYGLFEFQDDDGEELFYGKLNEVNGDEFTIHMIGSLGEIIKDYDYKFSFEEIRSISFETDYFESIRLLMIDNME